VTLRRLVPSEVDAERLSDLFDDARAIPAAAYSLSKSNTDRVLDISAASAQQRVVAIPTETVSLAAAAEHQWADFSR
jgi:hypothetical protein